MRCFCGRDRESTAHSRDNADITCISMESIGNCHVCQPSRNENNRPGPIIGDVVHLDKKRAAPKKNCASKENLVVEFVYFPRGERLFTSRDDFERLDRYYHFLSIASMHVCLRVIRDVHAIRSCRKSWDCAEIASEGYISRDEKREGLGMVHKFGKARRSFLAEGASAWCQVYAWI